MPVGHPPPPIAVNRRSRPPPATGKPGFRFPVQHPYAASASPTTPVSPFTASVGLETRSETPEERLLHEMGLDDPPTPQHQQRFHITDSPPPPNIPLPPLPAAHPSSSPQDPFRDPGQSGREPAQSVHDALTGSSFARHGDSRPSYTVSETYAGPPTERKGSDASYRAHDSPIPFRSLSGRQGRAPNDSDASAAALPPALDQFTSLNSYDEKRAVDLYDGKSERGYVSREPYEMRDYASASELADEQKKKHVKKAVAFWLIAFVLLVAIAVAVGVTVSNNAAREAERDAAVAAGGSSALASSTAADSDASSSGSTVPGSSTAVRTVSADTTRVAGISSTLARFASPSRSAWSAARARATPAAESSPSSQRSARMTRTTTRTEATHEIAATHARARTTAREEPEQVLDQLEELPTTSLRDSRTRHRRGALHH
ncbi:hypothetical protein Rhopal_004637-T1 [Rhodotorula paludigena]|uniref:Proteophosphoglycan ppg4 n=1 Tax=Rhodotorula paludigena TaxID=86838 RepID=A0AAV5GM99_9BASI|nr:hypothetical protein Rhopal_004637-T1 [Rhodotorula paludigena]